MIRLDPLYGCYRWTGPTDREGYPLDCGRRVHRTAYIERYGPIPEGKELDHVCRRRNCVRPEHLEPVTRSENERRKSFRRRMRIKHCPAGHDYYTHGRLTKEGGRVCMACAPAVLDWTTGWLRADSPPGPEAA